MGRFPVTLYKEQWLRILASASEIEAFIAENVLRAEDEGVRLLEERNSELRSYPGRQMQEARLGTAGHPRAVESRELKRQLESALFGTRLAQSQKLAAGDTKTYPKASERLRAKNLPDTLTLHL